MVLRGPKDLGWAESLHRELVADVVGGSMWLDAGPISPLFECP